MLTPLPGLYVFMKTSQSTGILKVCGHFTKYCIKKAQFERLELTVGAIYNKIMVSISVFALMQFARSYYT